MSGTHQTLGEQLIALLEHYNVNTVFGIPGVHTIELYRGLASSSIRHITPRHEQGAGFMADGYARATGDVGVCLCITGPGMTNIITPMGQAFADSIPMLVISSVNKSDTQGLGLGHLHELKNQSELVSGVAAFSHTLSNPDDLPTILAKAFALFSSARARPVHIEIPIDMMTVAVSTVIPTLPPPPSKPAPDQHAIDTIVRHIEKANTMIILVGGGCINAQQPLNQFVELTGSPTCLTINARGLLAPDNPLLLDGVQTNNAFRDYVAKSDLCIAIGTELGETDYDFYATGPLQPGGTMVRIDIDQEQLHNNAKPNIGIVSDASLALEALCKAITRSKNITPQKNAKAIVNNINESLANSFSEPCKQYEQLFSAINQSQPDAIIVGDSTKPVYHGNFVYRSSAPRRWFNSATGYGTLGYAMPAAIGAKLAKPELPVIALVGDGGFQFTLNELIVGSQEGVGIAIIVWNNNAYREIQDFMERSDIEPVGVDIKGPDLAALAKAMYIDYVKAESIASISTLLDPLSNLKRPLIIEVIIAEDA